jgi:CubicO group peptidase (beta-lactamase class C family)
MRNNLKKIIGVFGFLFLISFVSVLAADEKSDKVDKIFAPWDTIKDGRIIYERGYGMAKLEDGIVITPQKIFDIGSTSKQFTAACLAILIRQGKVGLEDDLRKYFPEMRSYQKPLLVKHLVYHTSGFRDFAWLLVASGFRPESDCPNIDEALDLIFKQKALNYPPGEEFHYNNTGYFLMGQLVERVSGKTLNAFAQENIFKPLGMTHTLFQQDHNQLIKNRASGYVRSEQGYRLNMSNWDMAGPGGLYTSVEDLYLWDQAFYNDQLGKGLMDILHTTGVLDNGNYAYGLFIDEYKGLKTVSHGGSWVGFRAGFVRFPEQKFSVICLGNLASLNTEDLCLKVADIYLADSLKEEPKDEKKKAEPITLSKTELIEKVGQYRALGSGIWFSVLMKEDKLELVMFGMEIPIVPISPTRFEAQNEATSVVVEFRPDDKGHIDRASVDMAGVEHHDLIKVPPLAPLSLAQLKEYEGDYVSDELLNTNYRFVAAKDGLVLKFRNAPRLMGGGIDLPQPIPSFKAMAADQFAQGMASIDFVRTGKKITGFKLNTPRASGIEFVKK